MCSKERAGAPAHERKEAPARLALFSPEGELTDGILDQLAKYERAKTAERSRRGKLRWSSGFEAPILTRASLKASITLGYYVSLVSTYDSPFATGSASPTLAIFH